MYTILAICDGLDLYSGAWVGVGHIAITMYARNEQYTLFNYTNMYYLHTFHLL